MLLPLIIDAWRFLVQCLRPAPALAAENLFLRKQLALYEERQMQPRRATDATRLAMVWLSHWFDWRAALRVVQPETFTRWHRQEFRLLWRGNPRQDDLRCQRLAGADSPHGPGESHLGSGTHRQRTVAQARPAGVPRTVRRYAGDCVESQEHDGNSTLVYLTRNHAQGIVACDFCVVVTASFRILYVFVVIEHEPPSTARECDGASHGTVDPAPGSPNQFLQIIRIPS